MSQAPCGQEDAEFLEGRLLRNPSGQAARLVLSFWNPHIAAFAQLHALSFRIQSSGDKLIEIGIKVGNHARYVVSAAEVCRKSGEMPGSVAKGTEEQAKTDERSY